MYKIYANNELLYEPDQKELCLISSKLDLEINNAGSFTFSMPCTHPSYNAISKFKTVIEIKSDDESIFFGRCIEESLDLFKNKTIYCEGELAILNDTIQRPSESHDITVRGFLELLINSHNSQVNESNRFTVGSVTVTDSNDSLYRYTNYENTLTAIKNKLVDKLGGYLRIRHENGVRYIDYLKDLPDRCTQNIQFGSNLLDYSSNIDATDIVTRLIPLGAKLEESQYTSIDERVTIKSVNSGSDFIQSSNAVDQYGIVTKVQIWDDVNDPTILKRKGQEYLEAVQWESMILNISAIDMHMLNPEIEQINIGDEILAVSEPHGLSKIFPVQKMSIDLLNPSNNTIQLGSNGDISISTRSNSIAQTADEANDFPISSVLKSAKDNATNMIQMATNGFIVLHMSNDGHPDELLVMDTADITTARKVWRWNVNGLGYSSTGYNGTYGLAMTMDGAIVADKITTGTLNGNNVNITNLNASNITSGTISADKINGGTLQGVSVITNNAQITGGSINIQTTQSSNDLIDLVYSSSSGSTETKIRAGYIGVYINNTLVTQLNPYVNSKRFYHLENDGSATGGYTGNFYGKYGENVTVKGGIITNISS